MEFLKRNIGLLAFSLVSLVLAGFLIVKIFGQMKEAHAQYAKVKEQQDEIENISKLEIALTPENLDNARKNVELAQKKYTAVRMELWKKFNIPPENATPVECMRILQKECLKLAKMLQDKEVAVPQSLRYFSFEQKVSRLPRAEEVPVILKELRIINEIVRVVGDSYIVQLQSLQRLTDTAVIEKDWYTVIPFKIVVVGELPRVQEFINRLQEKTKYYFLVRYFSLEGSIKGGNGLPNLPTGGGGTGGGQTPGMGGGGEGGMMGAGAAEGAGGGPAAGMMMAQAGGGNEMMMAGGPAGMGPGAAMPGGGAGNMMEMAAGGGLNPAGARMGVQGMQRGLAGARGYGAARKETREDRIIFKKPQMVTASVRFDFIEFHKPETEN